MRGERMTCWLAEWVYYSYFTTQLPKEVTKPHSEATDKGRERSKVRSMQELCCQQAWCTYIFHTICGYRLVATINGALGYYYDIQPFSSCPILWVTKDTLHEIGQNKAPGGPKARDRTVEAVRLIFFCCSFVFKDQMWILFTEAAFIEVSTHLFSPGCMIQYSHPSRN